MPLSRRRLFAALLVVCLGTLTAPLDSAVNIAFPSITSAFGLEQAGIRWVIISYVLTYASLSLVFGKVGDLLGYRRVFVAGLFISELGFEACAAAPKFAAHPSRCRGRTVMELRASARDVSLSGERADTRPRILFGGNCDRHGAWTARRWRARAELRLARRVLGATTNRVGGPGARLAHSGNATGRHPAAL